MPPPEFLIAGERRAGTTTLHHWLACSPRVAVPDAADSMWFLEEELKGAEDPGRSVDAARWEATHAPEDYAARFEALPADRARGEKCADLLAWPPAQTRLDRFVPGVHLLVTLRDPVERAWSHYWNEVGKGREHAGFEDAIRRDLEDRHATDWQRFHLSFARRGFYDESLVRLFETFAPERVLVLVLEESRRDPQATLDRIHRFLGVAPSRVALTARPVNRNWTSVRRPWVDRLGCVRVERACESVVRRLASRALRGSPLRWSRTREITAAALWPFRSPASSQVMPSGVAAQLRALYAPHVAALERLLRREAPLPWGTS